MQELLQQDGYPNVQVQVLGLQASFGAAAPTAPELPVPSTGDNSSLIIALAVLVSSQPFSGQHCPVLHTVRLTGCCSIIILAGGLPDLHENVCLLSMAAVSRRCQS